MHNGSALPNEVILPLGLEIEFLMAIGAGKPSDGSFLESSWSYYALETRSASFQQVSADGIQKFVTGKTNGASVLPRVLKILLHDEVHSAQFIERIRKVSGMWKSPDVKWRRNQSDLARQYQTHRQNLIETACTKYSLPKNFEQRKLKFVEWGQQLQSGHLDLAGVISSPAISATNEISAHSLSNSNPKPLMIGGWNVPNTFVMAGNEITPMTIAATYEPRNLALPADIREVLPSILLRDVQNSRKIGSKFWDGPNTGLHRLSFANSYQSASGEEAEVVTLELRPVGWYEFTALHTHLDEEIFPTEPKTLRQRHANSAKLFEHQTDLSFCQLSNLITVMMIPITVDGYGLIQQRSTKGGVSVNAGKLSAGVTENIHRYLDDSQFGNLWLNVNQMDNKAAETIDNHFKPKGVPSPYLAAKRGIFEELSTEMYRLLDSNERFKFLNVIFDTHEFHPYLVGIIELPWTVEESMRLISEFRGKDHTESKSIEALVLEQNDKRTLDILKTGAWAPGACAAFVAALKFFRATRQQDLQMSDP